MNNRLVYIIGMLVLFAFADKTSAQEWNKQDSLRLQEILNSDEELELNQQMIDAIDFGSGGIGPPMISTEKQWLMPDESLPVALPNKQPLDKKVYLSLRPYTANTPYDYDPVRQKKIKVKKDTWRNDPFRNFKTQFI